MEAAQFQKDLTSLAKYISAIIAEDTGNILGSNQQSMVINRMRKRLIDLGHFAPCDYMEYLKDHYDQEIKHLISLLTTHHTFFFREFCHFEYLLANIDRIVAKVRGRGDHIVRIMSAACSRGQEVYSLAMFFEKELENFPGMSYQILGTDIDTECVKHGQNGVYKHEEIISVPEKYMTGHWSRGTGNISNFVKVKNHLKDRCSFKTYNLLQEKVNGSSKDLFDIIFCRNCFIYFDVESITKAVRDLKDQLHEEGILVTGLSESLKNIDIEKITLAPSVYKFKRK